MSQAEHPHGLLGQLFGRIMAILNADMETRVADMLGLTGTESVLEVGFGPGVDITHLVRRLPHGAVAGVEISQEMVTAATKRNRDAVAAGTVDLQMGSSANLSWPDAAFDAVMAVTCVQFWDPLEQHLTEIRRVLRPGGTLAIGVHASSLPEGQSNSERAATQRADRIQAAGFEITGTEVNKARSGAGVFLAARREG